MSRSFHPVPGAGYIRTTPLTTPLSAHRFPLTRAQLQDALDDVTSRLARRTAEEDALRAKLAAPGVAQRHHGYSATVASLHMQKYDLERALAERDDLERAAADAAHTTADALGG